MMPIKLRPSKLLREFTTSFHFKFDTANSVPFTNDVALELAIALRDDDILESIHLFAEYLTRESEGVTELGKSLAQLSNLHTVKLGVSYEAWRKGDGAADLLLGCLGKNENVHELELGGQWLSEGFAKFLRSKRPRPLTLKLYGCRISDPQMPQMLEVISGAFRDSNVQSLCLSPSFYWERELGRKLLEACRNHRCLQQLTIHDRHGSHSARRPLRLSDGEGNLFIRKELFDDLGVSRIVELVLADTWFTTQAVHACTHYLRTNTFLLELSIRNCEFGCEESLGDLLSALHSSHGSDTRLRKLELDFNNRPLNSRIPVLIRDLLLRNQTIESLRLKANLYNACLHAVAEGIRGNHSLKELDLSYRGVLSNVGHFMPTLMQRPKPLRLIMREIINSVHLLHEIAGALEGQVRLKQLAFSLQNGTDCTTRFFRSLAINEHLVDLSVGTLYLESVGALVDNIGSFTALETLSFGWPHMHLQPADSALCSRFLEAMKQNKTLLSVQIDQSPFKAGEVEWYTLRNAFNRYGRHEVAIRSGWPTGLASHLLCRFLPKNHPHLGIYWAISYLKEISAGVGHPKPRIGGKRELDEGRGL